MSMCVRPGCGRLRDLESHGYCLPCRQETGRAKRERGHQLIVQAKSRPCMDCGVSYPHYVMDFDHCRGKKHKNVGEMRSHSVKAILAEIEKCDVVCSNCHRERTYRRSQE